MKTTSDKHIAMLFKEVVQLKDSAAALSKLASEISEALGRIRNKKMARWVPADEFKFIPGITYVLLIKHKGMDPYTMVAKKTADAWENSFYRRMVLHNENFDVYASPSKKKKRKI